MGVYTSVMFEGEEIQIKTGTDRCDYYGVGDVVDWTINLAEKGAGCLLDGVFEGIFVSDARQQEMGTPWVVIKDHKVHAVIHRGGPTLLHGEFSAIKSSLALEYDIQSLPESLWADGLMAAHAKEAEAEEAEAQENAVAFLAKYGPGFDQSSEAMAYLYSDGLNIDLIAVYFDEDVVAFDEEMRSRGFTYEVDFEKVLSGGHGCWVAPRKDSVPLGPLRESRQALSNDPPAIVTTHAQHEV